MDMKFLALPPSFGSTSCKRLANNEGFLFLSSSGFFSVCWNKVPPSTEAPAFPKRPVLGVSIGFPKSPPVAGAVVVVAVFNGLLSNSPPPIGAECPST